MGDEPGMFKWAGGLIAATLSGAVGWVWRKADNAATKEELARVLERIDKSNDDWRETTRQLYANAESDRRQFRDSILTVTEKIHMAKNDVLIEIARHGTK